MRFTLEMNILALKMNSAGDEHFSAGDECVENAC